KSAAARVSQMLDLRNIIKNLPPLQTALEGSQSRPLRIIHEMLSDERLAKIESLVCTHLNEDILPAKVCTLQHDVLIIHSLQGGISAVNARVYAVKANCNRLLDVARETYKENVGDIVALNRSLSEAHSLPLSLLYQETGFVFTLRKDDLGDELPRGFINATLKKGKWSFTSMDLKKMNAKMKDALDETLILSERIIHDLVADILVDVGALYKASEAVALLDVLWSFAHSSLSAYPDSNFDLVLLKLIYAVHNYGKPGFETRQSRLRCIPSSSRIHGHTGNQIWAASPFWRQLNRRVL
ncbi:DNA mismatch repair protein MutS, partial [Mycena olivaceomarginata]